MRLRIRLSLVRFLLEASFLVLVAAAVGLAGLSRLWIAAIMFCVWLLVALLERGETRSGVVRRTAGEPAAEEEPAAVEPAAEEMQSEAEPEPEPEPQPEAEAEAEPSRPRRLRSLLRRHEPEPEAAEPTAPRHVKLLPRRTAPGSSRASEEVAELFGEREEPAKPEETGT